RSAGLTRLTVARPETGDLDEDESATRVAAAMAGSGLTMAPARHGRVDLLADRAGLLNLDEGTIHAVNAIDEGLTIATLPDGHPVAAGQVVATVKIIPFFVPEKLVGRANEREDEGEALSVRAFQPLGAYLIQTRLDATSDKMLAKTERVTRARIEALGGTLMASVVVRHDEAALMAALQDAAAGDLVLIAGASATSDRRDVVPAALIAADGEVERLGMPVDPGNLLLLGSRSGRPVIGLPGCARSPKRNGFDLVLERLFAGKAVTGGDIAAMGAGGLLSGPRPDTGTTDAATPLLVGALVLAAGRSSRMGSNKLTAALGDSTVLGTTVNAVRDAGLPHIVVTGHDAAAARAVLPESTHIVHAARYEEGMAASLRAGLAAMPDDWDAVIVMLGDMPLIPAALLQDLAAAALHAHAIVAPTFAGRRGNPVLWGRAHIPDLKRLTGDFGGKALLAERQDRIVDIDAGTDAIFMDADTPEALAAIRARIAGLSDAPARD
ncbi:MAG: molybdopterin-binding/glycosyltransferase family 2 protein, partial [Pseudomonadota bacterium]